MMRRLPSRLVRSRTTTGQLKKNAIFDRTIVISVVEPSLDSSIPERPCSVALVQDQSLYGKASAQRWQEKLGNLFLKEFGMTFASLDLIGLKNIASGEEALLKELQTDLAELMTPQLLVIARGPLVSWLAQLYLESYALAGLILVDPIPLDGSWITPTMEEQLPSDVADLLRAFPSSSPLLLEPGVVPTMILSTYSSHPIMAEGARQTAHRHQKSPPETNEILSVAEEESSSPVVSWAPGTVPIRAISNDDDRLQATFRECIHPWIYGQIL